jgi:hypothetical protein
MRRFVPVKPDLRNMTSRLSRHAWRARRALRA